MIVSAAVFSDMGRVRRNNEDNFFLNGIFMNKETMDAGSSACFEFDASCQLYAICDGMGGETNGEQASYDAVSALLALKEKLADTSPEKIGDLINRYTSETNAQILSYGKHGHMGTTLALLCIKENFAVIAHMGDSRIYLVQGEELTPLTTDHTEAQRLLSLGIITEEECVHHPLRNAIVRYLGMFYPGLEITATIHEPLEVYEGDRFLLCSDGLTDMVPTKNIGAAIINLSSQEAVLKLGNMAIEAGGTDNITVLIADVLREPETRVGISALLSNLLLKRKGGKR